MKKLLILLLALMLAWPAMAEFPEEIPNPIYLARLHADTRIRKVKDMDSREWLGRVPEDGIVEVYEYGEEWCLCGYEGDVGWIATDRLYEMWVVSDVPLPGFIPVIGLAVMLEEAYVTVEGYEGNTLQPGDLVVIASPDGMVTMNRDTAQLPEGSFRYEAFVPWQDARPGDALYGFTTWYQVNGKDKLIAGRVWNIEQGVERVNGTVIHPGEEFSFNELCDPYTRENGYRLAPNISHDGVGVSGGVCQVSTTIFQALQGMNVELTDWHVHSYAGVKYARRNHDSAVSDWKDLRFVNHYDFPIELTMWAQDGVLTCVFRRGGD